MENLISVIIPVYNVEKYLKKCVDSIINQTYNNLEIILVDDGSTDKSGIICDELSEVDSRIKVIHQENGGLSAARNSGLDTANGEYIGFVDSDDFIEAEMYKKMMDSAILNDAELVICGVNITDENGTLISRKCIPNEIITKKEILNYIFESDKWQYVTAWNRLYKKSIFKELRFLVGKNNEDMFLDPYIFERCTRIATVSDFLYNYLQRSGSIMHLKTSAKMLNAFESHYSCYIYLCENDYDEILKEKALNQSCFVYGIYRWRVKAKNENEIKYIKYIDSIFLLLYQKIRPKCVLLRKFPSLYSYITTLKLILKIRT